MPPKTVSDQAFGGQRISLGRIVYIEERNEKLDLMPRPANCVGIDENDLPEFRSQWSGKMFSGLVFAAEAPMLDVGRWTWPPRV
jgi:hypothetical protein